MSNWTRSNVSREQLLRLVEAGQLPPLTDAVEWRVPGDESVPRPPRGMWCRSWPSPRGMSFEHLRKDKTGAGVQCSTR
jgi:hypothetical protein